MEIEYPKRMSEFDLQAILYGKLRTLGYDVHGEVKVKKSAEEKGVRFDLVIFKDGQAALLIEVKARVKSFVRSSGNTTKQYQKYSAYGIPLVYCFGDIERTVNEIKDKLE